MDINKLVDRFLAWPLPATVCADLCATRPDYPHQRVGTNLLTADEARQMLEHVLAPGQSECSGDMRSITSFDQWWGDGSALSVLGKYDTALAAWAAGRASAHTPPEEREHCARCAELERERDQYLKYWTSVREALPVSVSLKGRWPWAIFYNGYWFVKKSYAERASHMVATAHSAACEGFGATARAGRPCTCGGMDRPAPLVSDTASPQRYETK